MTRDDILRMVMESCDPNTEPAWHNGFWTLTQEELERFAALVAAAEREACAKSCEEIEDDYRERESLRYAELKTDAQTGASDCAHRIRARGDA